MKGKIFNIVVAFMLSQAICAQSESRYVGDVDADGVVSMKDVVLLVSQISSQENTLGAVGDMDCDGILTLSDVSLLVDEILRGEYSTLSEFVDLGLSVKWARTNVNAATPDASGSYLTWDEAKAQESDASRLPQSEEITELLTLCEWSQVTINDRLCYRVVGPSGKSIMLPAAGIKVSSTLQDDGKVVYCWSSTLDEDIPSSAHVLSSIGYKDPWSANCSFALTVRMVEKK